MPRPLRIDVPNTVYHVFSRAPNKTPLLRSDEDCFFFMKYLKRAKDLYPVDFLGYSLMTTHYHLQIKTYEEPLALILHHLNTLYACYFNRRYRRAGHVFQGRFRSIPVETDSYLLTLSRYIHLNAVKAGMVDKPEDHRWSSYRDYIGGSASGWVSTELVLDTLSANKNEQRERYRTFVEDGVAKKLNITDELIWQTRVFGSPQFAQELAVQHPEAFEASGERGSK